MRYFFVIVSGLFLGIALGILSLNYFKPLLIRNSSSSQLLSGLTEKQTIGFLPYWLLSFAKQDYSQYISTLTYFGLRVDADGSIVKLQNPQEEEPGWNALSSGKLDPFFKNALRNGVSLSLLISSGDDTSIEELISNPQVHAEKLVNDFTPLMQQYNFTDLNLDIEYTKPASDDARNNFSEFAKDVRQKLNPIYSLTIELTGDDLINNKLIDPMAIGKVADKVVIMTYDYHFPGSFVTGPVAPLNGAGVTSEYDVTKAVQKALEVIPSEKIILGIPTYGYEWEALSSISRSAVIPGTGLTASTRRAEDLLNSCASCSATFDNIDQEERVSYFDTQTSTYHQLFFPNKTSTSSKIALANSAQLGGIAIWALGYEDNTILNPLRNYK